MCQGCPQPGVIFVYKKMARSWVPIEIKYNCSFNRVLFTMYFCIPTDMLYCIIDTVVSKTWTTIFMKCDSTNILHFAKKNLKILFTERYSEILSNKLLTWCKVFSAGFIWIIAHYLIIPKSQIWKMFVYFIFILLTDTWPARSRSRVPPVKPWKWTEWLDQDVCLRSSVYNFVASSGTNLAEIEYNIHKYAFISV